MKQQTAMTVVEAFTFLRPIPPNDPRGAALVGTAAQLILGELQNLADRVVPGRHAQLRDDVVQTTLVRLLSAERTRAVESEAQVRAYLRSALRNNFLSEIERRGLASLDEHPGWEPEPVAPGQPEALDTSRTWELLLNMTEALASQSRTDLAANLRLCATEWRSVLVGDDDLDSLAERSADPETEPAERRRIKNRFEQRHCRARSRVGAFIQRKVLTNEIGQADAELLLECLDATKRRKAPRAV